MTDEQRANRYQFDLGVELIGLGCDRIAGFQICAQAERSYLAGIKMGRMLERGYVEDLSGNGNHAVINEGVYGIARYGDCYGLCRQVDDKSEWIKSGDIFNATLAETGDAEIATAKASFYCMNEGRPYMNLYMHGILNCSKKQQAEIKKKVDRYNKTKENENRPTKLR